MYIKHNLFVLLLVIIFVFGCLVLVIKDYKNEEIEFKSISESLDAEYRYIGFSYLGPDSLKLKAFYETQFAVAPVILDTTITDNIIQILPRESYQRKNNESVLGENKYFISVLKSRKK